MVITNFSVFEVLTVDGAGSVASLQSQFPIPNWQLAALAMATPSHRQGFRIGDSSAVARPSAGGGARRPIPRCPSSL